MLRGHKSKRAAVSKREIETETLPKFPIHRVLKVIARFAPAVTIKRFPSARRPTLDWFVQNGAQAMAHGVFVDGVWHSEWYDASANGGCFVPAEPVFRNWITPDGSPGPSGKGGFAAERGRYHLYVSLACPYAHRTVIFRKLKDLESAISISILDPVMGEQGWEFGASPGTIADTVNGKKRLGEIYLLADPRYTGRVSVPVLWDKERRTIVNNESPEIIRMLNTAFAALTNDRTDYYPPELRSEIDRINARVYNDVNIGVYRAGFATAQRAYEEGCRAWVPALDWIEDILSRQR